MAWKNKMVKQMNTLKGVKEHGRIGHRQIIEESFKADIFAYPCVFPEVNCISYCKAMAGGAIPVSSDYAALLRYKDDGGVQVHYDINDYKQFEIDYIDDLIKTLKEPRQDRAEMMKAAVDKYSWHQTALDWDKCFKEEKVK